MMNSNIGLIAGREISTRVREKSFLISTGVTMAVIIIGAVVWSMLAGGDSAERIGVDGGDSSLSASITASGDAAATKVDIVRIDDESQARAKVSDGDVDAALVAGPDGTYTAIGKTGLNSTLEGILRSAVSSYQLDTALRDRGVDPSTLDFGKVTVSQTEPVKDEVAQRVSIALIGSILLVMAIMTGGVMVSVGVVEEKTSRIVELLLSSVRPLQLLWGKILGIGAIALTQVVLLGATAMIAGAATGLLTLAGTAATMFAAVLVWFILGFLFFASLYAATGAIVSRQEELSSTSAPLTFLVLAVLYSGTFGVQALDSTLISTLSWIPPFSAVLMPIRIATGDTNTFQVVGTLLLMIVACGAAVWAASRIYERSVLRTGSRIKWAEVAGMLGSKN